MTFEGGRLVDPTTGVDAVGGPVSLETTAPLAGSYSARVAGGSTAYLQESFTATDDFYAAFSLRLRAKPTATVRVVQVTDSGTTVGNLQITATGELKLRNGSTTIGSISPRMDVGTTYRIGLHQRRGTGGNAVLEAFLMPADHTGMPFGTPFARSQTGSWTTAADRLRIGPSSGTVDLDVDDLSLDTAAMP